MMFEIQVVLLLIMTAIAGIQFPDLVRFDPRAYLRHTWFLAYSILFGIILQKVFLANFFPDLHAYFVDQAREVMIYIDGPDLMRVWWEDLAYVAPSLFLARAGYKKLAFVVFCVCAIDFVSGHMYQGVMGYMSITYIIISRFVSAQSGLFTMMMLHVTWDLFVFIYSKILLR